MKTVIIDTNPDDPTEEWETEVEVQGDITTVTTD